jgi:hypothetical protein
MKEFVAGTVVCGGGTYGIACTGVVVPRQIQPPFIGVKGILPVFTGPDPTAVKYRV